MAISAISCLVELLSDTVRRTFFAAPKFSKTWLMKENAILIAAFQEASWMMKPGIEANNKITLTSKWQGLSNDRIGWDWIRHIFDLIRKRFASSDFFASSARTHTVPIVLYPCSSVFMMWKNRSLHVGETGILTVGNFHRGRGQYCGDSASKYLWFFCGVWSPWILYMRPRW